MKCMKLCVDKFINSPKGLRLPPKFTREVGGWFRNRVVLRNRMGSTWTVFTGFDDDGTILLRDGWGKFRDDNRVKHQDICLFHYDGEGSFLVHVFGKHGLEKVPSTDEGHPDCNVNCKRFFKVYYHKNFVHPASEMALPPMWSHRAFNPCPGSVQLVNKFGARWVVQLKVTSDGCFVLSNGFQQFIVHNRVTVGEFMFFTVVGEGVFRVDIFETSCFEKNGIMHENIHDIIEISDDDEREREIHIEVGNVKTEAGLDDELGDPMDAEDGGTSENDGRTEEGAMAEDKSAQSGNDVHPDAFPTFTLLIRQSYFDTPRLPIPMEFWTTHIAQKKVVGKRVDLFMNGATWSVGLNRQPSRIAMRHQIRPFLEENSIKVGTTCVFELGPTDELRFNVKIAD